MLPQDLASDLLAYMVQRQFKPGDQLPALTDLSQELGISVNKLREQLEVARALELVDVRPRAGIRVRALSFTPAVRLSLLYALAQDRGMFQPFADLRVAVEVGFWREAVSRLAPEDRERLTALVARAWTMLSETPVRIPHGEHREFHLLIFSRLDNPFVTGILESYWDGYEAVEYDTYVNYRYLREVWEYHRRIAEAICAGDVEGSLNAFVEHTRLLRYRDTPGSEHAPAVEVHALVQRSHTAQENGAVDVSEQVGSILE